MYIHEQLMSNGENLRKSEGINVKKGLFFKNVKIAMEDVKEI